VSEQPPNRRPPARIDRDWLHLAAAWDRKASARLRVSPDRGAAFGLAWLGAHLGDGYLWFTLAGLGLWLGDEVLRRGVLR